MYAENNEKRRDPHRICLRGVEEQFPRTLKMTPPYVLATPPPPRYPLDRVIYVCLSKISCLLYIALHALLLIFRSGSYFNDASSV